MGRNGIRKKTTRLTDNQDTEAFMSSTRTYAKEIFSVQRPEDDVYAGIGRNSTQKRISGLTDSQDEEPFMSSKRACANENFPTQQAEENVYSESMDKMTISYHYGGYFTFSPSRKYVHGKLKKIDDIDVDFICFFDMVDDLKQHCSFDVLKGDKFFYLRGDRAISDYDGLVECRDDSDVQNMLHSYQLNNRKPIEIYTLPNNCDILMSTSVANSSRHNVFDEVSEPGVEEHESSDGLETNPTGDGVETNPTGSNTMKRKTRGPTRCVKIINLKEGEKFHVEFDEDNQVIGDNSTQFIWFLGQTVRNRTCCPLKVTGWKGIEQIKIDTMWDIILEKFTFDVSESRKGAILGHMSDLYRDYRHKLKRKYFDSKSSYQLRLRNKPKHIPADEWKYLVNLWSDADFQKRSMQNKTNRSKRSLPPYTGTKSYARLRNQMTIKNGKAPSRVDLFKESRKRKNGKEVDDFQQDAITQFDQLKKQRDKGEISLNDDEIFAEVLGAEKNGYLRAYGPGKSISEYFGGRPTKIELIKQVEATRKEANERVEEARKEANERVEEARKEANERVEEVKREAREQIEGFKKDMDSKLAEYDRRLEEKIRMLATQRQLCPNDATFMEES